MNRETNKVDPGWNDPPMLEFNACQPTPKSRIGNKRVPFPLGPSNAPQKSVLHSDMDNAINDTSEEAIQNMKDVTFSNFESVLNSKCSDEVHGKIKLMKEMWTLGKFSTSLKNDLYKLSNSIVRKDIVTANKLNLELHMKYPSHCKDWISAVGFLINDK
ncbi:uncharacterized protein LOC123317584 [Coccinella septempunctata]|uniref:uncharacterized protein LOC123317584 n=1 Tax=Coccinella septempunctata TaxID=41139 RepID=UPI001D088EC4|nr:uncharacterized protein LOC123317584 [Coccinella septempunctata]